MAAVELDGVWASYPGQGEAAAARAEPRLREVDIQLEAGQLCALLGPNGAGKSTLVRVIAGLLPPSRGRVRLFGTESGRLSRQQIAKRVAVVPQRGEVGLGFSVRQVVGMGRAAHQGALLRASRADERVVEQTLERCELGALADRSVSTLSGGEQKRVHIARALAQQAPVLLLDEAAAHLDIRHSIALYELVRAEVSERGLACLAVMHDLSAAAQHADRVVLLKAGRVVADGSVAEVMTATTLGDAFDADIRVGRCADAECRYFVPISSRIST